MDAIECGNERYRLGDYDGAMGWYSQALEAEHLTAEERSRLHGNRAQALIQIGDLEKALKDLEQAIGLDETNWKAYLRKAKVLALQFKFDQAIESVSVLLRSRTILSSQVKQLGYVAKQDYERMKREHKPPPLTAQEKAALINKRQALRLGFKVNPTIEHTKQHIQVHVFVANEFGLFSQVFADRINAIRLKAEFVDLINAHAVQAETVPPELTLDERARASFAVVVPESFDENLHLRVQVEGRSDILPVLSGSLRAIRTGQGVCCCRQISHSILLAEDVGNLGIAGRIWDSALLLLMFLETNPGVVRDKTCLELGAGTGAVSIGAARLGAKLAMMTDLPSVVPLMKTNVELNHCEHNTIVQPLVWGEPPNPAIEYNIDIIFLSDVVYFPQAYKPLIRSLEDLCNGKSTIILWGHRHRNPNDHLFFQAFFDLFDVALIHGPGPRFLTKGFEKLQEAFKIRENEFSSRLGRLEPIPDRDTTALSRDVSLYLCVLSRKTRAAN